MPDRLNEYLSIYFGLEIVNRPLTSVSSMLINSPTGIAKVLVLSEGVTEKKRTYLRIHSASHILLGHSSAPYETILEPLPGGIQFTPKEENQHLQSEILTQGILRNRIERYWVVMWDSIVRYGISDSLQAQDVHDEALSLAKLLKESI